MLLDLTDINLMEYSVKYLDNILLLAVDINLVSHIAVVVNPVMFASKN